MGSFNTTCFVTQQTISCRNPCYILPIKQNSGYNGVKLTRGQSPIDGSLIGSSIASSTCYPDAFWKPYGGFIKAAYDDYGQVEIDFTDEETKKVVNALFEELSKDSFVTHVGENACHDVPFNISKYKDKSIEEAWKYMWTAAVHELRVFVTPYQDNSPRQFTFAILSEQAYDYLLAEMESATKYDGSSCSRDSIIDGFAAELEESMPRFNKPNDEHKGKYAKGGDGYESMRRHCATEIIRSAYNGYSNVHSPFYLRDDIYDYADELIENGAFSAATRAKMKEGMAFGYIMSGLDSMNIKISPMVYAGQDYSNSIGKAYVEMIKTVSEQINKQQETLYDY